MLSRDLAIRCVIRVMFTVFNFTQPYNHPLLCINWRNMLVLEIQTENLLRLLNFEMISSCSVADFVPSLLVYNLHSPAEVQLT